MIEVKEQFFARAASDVQRRFEQTESFFAAHGHGTECKYENEYGCGRAVVDFMQWEVDSTRLEKSPWWNLVNRMMVQDMLSAQFAHEQGNASTSSLSGDLWLNFAKDPTPMAFWDAHTSSLLAAVNSPEAMGLLARERKGEQTFIKEIVVPAAVWVGPDMMYRRGPRWLWDPSGTGVKSWVTNVYSLYGYGGPE